MSLLKYQNLNINGKKIIVRFIWDLIIYRFRYHLHNSKRISELDTNKSLKSYSSRVVWFLWLNINFRKKTSSINATHRMQEVSKESYQEVYLKEREKKGGHTVSNTDNTEDKGFRLCLVILPKLNFQKISLWLRFWRINSYYCEGY